MIQYDYHLHTINSHDGQSSMEEMLGQAIALGLKGICITEHLDFYDDMPKAYTRMLDLEHYANECKALREKYQSQIVLKFGIELTLVPKVKHRITEALEKYDFDFVIGSSHLVDDIDIGLDYGNFFQNHGDEYTYRRYLDSVYENILIFDDFDVYGHIDYIIRYGKDEPKYLDLAKYQEQIDKILLELIKRGKGIEVNTSGFKYGLGLPHPNYEILKRYKELGGEILTIGSDAHHTKHLALNFTEVRAKLIELGFTKYTIFEKRKPLHIEL